MPRSYVTGETVDSAFAALEGHDWARLIGRPRDFGALVAKLETLTLPEIESDPRGMAGNAARCAVELAILDAYGRRFGEPVGRAVELARADGLKRTPGARPVRYSGAITAESDWGEIVSAFKARVYGFHQVKVKVGTQEQDDPSRLARMRQLLGRRMDIRLDANEAWPAAELVERVRAAQAVWPDGARAAGRACRGRPARRAAADSGHPGHARRIALRLPGCAAAAVNRTADLLNVRLSKCGGIFPSLRIIALAQRFGLGVQLGCHPGETSLLSAAGRHVACRVAGLRYLEGSYDRHILAANVTPHDVTFHYGGRARPLTAPGLGVEVDPTALEAMTVSSREVFYE